MASKLRATSRAEVLISVWMIVVLGAAACGGGSGDDDRTAVPSGVPTVAQPGANSPLPQSTLDPNQTPSASNRVSTPAPAELKVTTVAGKQILSDIGGYTLYVFDYDTPKDGKSACNASCSQAWPPFIIDGAPLPNAGLTGELATLIRIDGTTQMTYDGRPLYRFQVDEKPGDTKGDGAGGTWHAATP